MITRNTLVLKLNSTINSFKTTQLYLILMINMLKMDINHKFKTTMKYNCKIRMSQLIPCLKFLKFILIMIQIHTCRRNRTSKYLKWTMILQKTIFWIRISTCSSQISLMHTIAIIKYIILRIKAKHKMAGIIKFNTKIHSVKLNSQPTHFKKFSSFNRSRRNIPSSLKEL